MDGLTRIGTNDTVEPQAQEVVVRDIRMRFGSMVVFMVKWALAAIPAIIILVVAVALILGVTGGLLGPLVGFRSSLGRSSPVSSLTAPASSGVRRADNVSESAGAAYLDKVVVRNLKVGQGALGQPGAFGEVKNTGDRILKEVEITVYCLNRDGHAVFEKTYTPVLVSELSFGDGSRPLRPGYSQGFGVKLDDAPSEWAKKVNVRVTGVKFQ